MQTAAYGQALFSGCPHTKVFDLGCVIKQVSHLSLVKKYITLLQNISVKVF